MMQPADARQFAAIRHRGLTLVELLIVIGILSLLAAVTLPNLRDIIRDQRFTRTSGLVQSYIAGAQAKAIGENRRYGVVIERFSNQSAIGRSHSVRLSYAYGPPDYTGDVAGARAIVTNNGGLAFKPDDGTLIDAALQQAGDGMAFPIIRFGDTIALGSVSNFFQIQGLRTLATGGDGFPAYGDHRASTDIASAPIWPCIDIPAEYRPLLLQQYRAGTPVPFRILRQPVPSMSASLELPEGTAIDLVCSGMGLIGDDFSPLAIENRRQTSIGGPLIANRYGNAAYNPAASPPLQPGANDFQSVTIMFDTQGGVSEVRYGAPNPGSVTVGLGRKYADANIYLMLGANDGVYPDAPFFFSNRNVSNLLNFDCSWIVINRQTGNVAVSPISPFIVDSAGNVINPNDSSVVAAGTATLQARIQAAIGLSRAEAAAHSAVNK